MKEEEFDVDPLISRKYSVFFHIDEPELHSRIYCARDHRI